MSYCPHVCDMIHEVALVQRMHRQLHMDNSFRHPKIHPLHHENQAGLTDISAYNIEKHKVALVRGYTHNTIILPAPMYSKSLKSVISKEYYNDSYVITIHSTPPTIHI